MLGWFQGAPTITFVVCRRRRFINARTVTLRAFCVCGENIRLIITTGLTGRPVLLVSPTSPATPDKPTSPETQQKHDTEPSQPWQSNDGFKSFCMRCNKNQGLSENDIRELIALIQGCIQHGLGTAEDWTTAFPRYTSYAQYFAECKSERDAAYVKQGWSKVSLTVTPQDVQGLTAPVTVPKFHCRNIMNLCRSVVANPVSGDDFIRHYQEHVISTPEGEQRLVS